MEVVRHWTNQATVSDIRLTSPQLRRWFTRSDGDPGHALAVAACVRRVGVDGGGQTLDQPGHRIRHPADESAAAPLVHPIGRRAWPRARCGRVRAACRRRWRWSDTGPTRPPYPTSG